MEKLKVYWVGYGGNAWMAEELRPIINELDMTLTTIHEHINADIKWNKDNWLEHLKKADIIIVPANYKIQPAKSANRLTQALSLGKPVICSPLPAYLDIAAKYPGSFLIAIEKEEWKEHLKLLRDTPFLREQFSHRALEVAKDFSIEAIGKKWIEIFLDKKTVDIVIPTYKNLKGLKHCLNSIRTCTTSYKIIVVNNGNDPDLTEYLNQQKDVFHIKEERLNFAQAVNRGIKAGTAQYVMILNDDVIVSKGWLQNMIEVCTINIGVVGLLSNCDKGWLHSKNINIGGVELLPGTNTFDQIEPIISQIYDYKTGSNEIIEREWVAFYATLIPRDVIAKVGILDETFENSGEDVDLCKRIRKSGYKIIQTYKSFCFHFGAISRKTLENEEHKQYHAADDRTRSYLNLKYSKPTVVIYSGPSWERWSFKSIEEGGIGGSETWQIWLARELSKLNYRVISFCDLPQQEMWEDNIRWVHFTQYPSFIEQNYIDYFISSRTTDTLKLPVRAGKIYVMCHDIWLLSPKEQTFQEKVNKYCVLSEWHKNFFKSYHNIIDDNKIIRTANGIDFSRYDGKGIKRHPYRLFWSSSLDRGLDTLLHVYDSIKMEIPELELHVYYGLHTWETSAQQKNDLKGLNKIEEIKKGMNKSGVFYHGRKSQKDLAEAQLSSSLWAYSTDFEEVFCITSIEAQRAGCPVIASNYAGLQTTIGDSGILIGKGIKGQSYTKEYQEKFIEECISILKDREKWEYWSGKGFKNTEKYSWKNVALMWQDLFKS